MPQTRELGPLFVHRQVYPSRDFPLADIGRTQEIEWPYRSARSLLLRMPFTRQAVVIGWWRRTEDDVDAALERALRFWRDDDLSGMVGPTGEDGSPTVKGSSASTEDLHH